MRKNPRLSRFRWYPLAFVKPLEERSGGHAEPWQRVKALFQSAIERPPEEREIFLRAATGDDVDLRRESSRC